jgi:hypothetical protein
MHLTVEGKLGIVLSLLGLGGAGAIMVAPQQFWIGWSLIAVAMAGGIALGLHHFWAQLQQLGREFGRALEALVPARAESLARPTPIASAPATPTEPNQTLPTPAHVATTKEANPEEIRVDDRLAILFAVNTRDRTVWLKFLPDDPMHKGADTLLIILYGYKKIFGIERVRTAAVDLSLRASRLIKPKPSEDRIAIFRTASLFEAPEYMTADEIFHHERGIYSNVEKLGLSHGGFYRLTDWGYDMAETKINDLLERA